MEAVDELRLLVVVCFVLFCLFCFFLFVIHKLCDVNENEIRPRGCAHTLDRCCTVSMTAA